MTALRLRTTLRKTTPRASKSDAGGLGEVSLHRILPRKEFMGKPIVPPSAAPSRPVNLGLGDLVLSATCLYSGVW